MELFEYIWTGHFDRLRWLKSICTYTLQRQARLVKISFNDKQDALNMVAKFIVTRIMICTSK